MKMEGNRTLPKNEKNSTFIFFPDFASDAMDLCCLRFECFVGCTEFLAS